GPGGWPRAWPGCAPGHRCGTPPGGSGWTGRRSKRSTSGIWSARWARRTWTACGCWRWTSSRSRRATGTRPWWSTPSASGCCGWGAGVRERKSGRFFELLGPVRCAQVRAVAMDMNSAYDLEVRAHCPNAEVVYDLFHVVAKYGREVIDRVRVDEADRLRADKPARRVVKTSRWLLLRNRENVPDEQVVRLEELLAANKALLTVYLLKEDLKGLWRYRREAWAWKAWKSWKRRALRSGLEPLRVFVWRLEPYLSGILAHCRWPLGTNLVEGINNKIKVIKRVAYGYRDDAYFFLKIRAAFPGLG